MALGLEVFGRRPLSLNLLGLLLLLAFLGALALLEAPRRPLRALFPRLGATLPLLPVGGGDGYLLLVLALLALGLAALAQRRYAFLHAFLVLEGLGLAVNLFYVVAGATVGNLEGEVVVLFGVAVAAAETAVGLALFLALALGGAPAHRSSSPPFPSLPSPPSLPIMRRSAATILPVSPISPAALSRHRRPLATGGLGSLLATHALTYPTPANLSYLWSFGSLSALCLGLQFASGIALAMHYDPSVAGAFASVEHIMRDVDGGWFLRYLHANGASAFFGVVYLHLLRGLLHRSYAYANRTVWLSGVVIFLLMMATAFIGYVLPWGQMSFWGATVITNLFSVVPVVGPELVHWIWGGFSVGAPTLNRFYSLHYLLPFLLAVAVLVHLFYLHSEGSSNPFPLEQREVATFYLPLYPYFLVKDLLGMAVFGVVFSYFLFYVPNALGHPDNYIEANPMVTPEHIVPEWYFRAPVGVAAGRWPSAAIRSRQPSSERRGWDHGGGEPLRPSRVILRSWPTPPRFQTRLTNLIHPSPPLRGWVPPAERGGFHHPQRGPRNRFHRRWLGVGGCALHPKGRGLDPVPVVGCDPPREGGGTHCPPPQSPRSTGVEYSSGGSAKGRPSTAAVSVAPSPAAGRSGGGGPTSGGGGRSPKGGQMVPLPPSLPPHLLPSVAELRAALACLPPSSSSPSPLVGAERLRPLLTLLARRREAALVGVRGAVPQCSQVRRLTRALASGSLRLRCSGPPPPHPRWWPLRELLDYPPPTFSSTEVLRPLTLGLLGAALTLAGCGPAPPPTAAAALERLDRDFRGLRWLVRLELGPALGALPPSGLLKALASPLGLAEDLPLATALTQALALGVRPIPPSPAAVLLPPSPPSPAAPLGGQLADMLLRPLDRWGEGLRGRSVGRRRRQQPVYSRLLHLGSTLRRRGWGALPPPAGRHDYGPLVGATAPTLRRLMRATPAADPLDPVYRRYRYLRVGPEVLLGVAGPRKVAEELKAEALALLALEGVEGVEGVVTSVYRPTLFLG